MNASEKVNFISNWIKDYVDNMPKKAESLVIGISGGIDSSVSSTLSAMTGLKTIVLSMPIKQINTQHDLSVKHGTWLTEQFTNVTHKIIDLDTVYNAFKFEMQIDFNNQHAFANSKSRLRMVTLYQIAGATKGIVVGTGNKVEDFGVGFYTKYGDGGVDLSPIADLTKTEVTALGKYLGVSEAIVQAPPTDGLWGDDRTDEDQIGASYPELEWAMARQDEGKQLSDFKGREREVFETYIKFHKANRHKMLPIPVCEILSELR